MTKLVEGGIATEARVIPILPGITDTSDSIDQLFGSIANTGVKRAAVSTLFLRPAITASIKRHITDEKTLENLLETALSGIWIMTRPDFIWQH
jgi:DNA repair photolyase